MRELDPDPHGVRDDLENMRDLDLSCADATAIAARRSRSDPVIAARQRIPLSQAIVPF